MEWLRRLLLASICLMVVVLVLTSLPTWQGEHMLNQRLMLHMMTGGGLVFAVPVFGMLFFGRVIASHDSTALQRFGFWLLMSAALVVIASVLACMLPMLATEQMNQTMTIHGYAGLATVPALLALWIGGAQRRRMKAMRSATPG